MTEGKRDSFGRAFERSWATCLGIIGDVAEYIAPDEGRLEELGFDILGRLLLLTI
jgi:hypothetical protein